jgi:putative sugar O-methyltransferase
MKKILQYIYQLLYKTKLSKKTSLDSRLIEELRSEVSNISPIVTDNLTGAELEWSNNVNIIIKNILNENPREFLSWDVVLKTMFVVRAKYINVELNVIKKSNHYKKIWKNALFENKIGRPTLFWKFPKSSGNLIHHLYHLLKFKEFSNIDYTKLEIVFEFGGGYGSMCRLLHNCGFNKKYIIFDLPVFGAIQKFYLKSLGINVLSPNEYLTSESGVICVSDFQELLTIFQNISEQKSKLFIGTWSFSETPIEFRKSFIPIISNFNFHLIAYQKNFNEANNIDYFNQFTSEIKKSKWANFEIEHLKNSYYLFGSDDSKMHICE